MEKKKKVLGGVVGVSRRSLSSRRRKRGRRRRSEPGHEETVDVEGVEEVSGVALDKTVDVNEGHDEKVLVAASVLCNTLDVSVDLDVWRSDSMEDRDSLVGHLFFFFFNVREVWS